MPPKTARGRGRGRGRGIAAPGRDERPGQQLEESQEMQDVSSLTNSSSSNTLPPDSTLSSIDASPSTSAKTEDPDPIKPDPTTERARADTMGRGRAKSAGPSKFKPKFVRRDQDARDKMAKEYEKQLALNAKEIEKMTAAANRARGRVGRGGRGRGDVMGKGMRGGARSGPVNVASGTFGVAPDALDKGQGFTGPRGYGGDGGGGGSGSSGWGTGSGGGGGVGGGRSTGGLTNARLNTLVKSDIKGGKLSEHGETPDFQDYENEVDRWNFYEPAYPDHAETADLRRVNIEDIGNMSDSSEDHSGNMPGAGSQNQSHRPIRPHRAPHQDRKTTVNIEPHLASEDEDEDEDDKEAISRLVSQQPDYQASIPYDREGSDVRVKTERNSPILSATEIRSIPDIITIPSRGTSKTATMTPSLQKLKAKKPIIQTEEEREEYERHLEDIAVLSSELGIKRKTTEDVDGDTDMDEADHKEGRLYLFQFPPILPQLSNPAMARKPAEEDDSNAEAAAEPKAPGEEEIIIKTEPSTSTAPGAASFSHDAPVPEEGFIGQLIVRESGKVELCWGGTNMVLGRGVDSDYLSTVVMTEEKTGPAATTAADNVAMGMGRVMGKFVVTPDWEKTR